jgi:hypothetical protein
MKIIPLEVKKDQIKRKNLKGLNGRIKNPKP